VPWLDNSTGIWTGVYLGGAPNYSAGKAGEVYISRSDKEILRRLANELAVLASQESESKKIKHWYEHNELKNKYPIIFADPENGWNEIITADMIKCRGDLARRWEVVLRKEIFYGREIKDDKPLERIFEIGYTYIDTEWGVIEEYQGGLEGHSYKWEAAINNEEDIKKIHNPEIIIDYRTTLETLGLAGDVFRDILNVKLRGVFWHGFAYSWDLSKFVGLQDMMLLMYDKPKLIHRLMKIILDGYMAKIDYLEKQNLLTLNNDNFYVGSGGLGFTTELPRESLDGRSVGPQDLWCHTESQETVGVSPQMFEEFIYQYQLPLQKRFGLNCYGCCEALEDRWPIIKDAPNLRRISVSQWADKARMAELLEDKYIYSAKPSPTDLALPQIDEEAARKRLREILEASKGCVVELLMKDNHTLGGNPHNIIRWVEIAREEIARVYG